MTVQEFYDWAKENNLLNARILTETNGGRFEEWKFFDNYYIDVTAELRCYNNVEEESLKSSFPDIDEWDNVPHLKKNEEFVVIL